MTAPAPEAAQSPLGARPVSASSFSASLDQVSKLFGSFAAFARVSVNLEPGRCYVLIGENGAGKSTLLRIWPACFAQLRHRQGVRRS